MAPDAQGRAASLKCWSGRVEPEPISGGISNHNYLVRDRGERFFVRIGDDLPIHGVSRENEARASRAAHAAGVSPELLHAEPGALVFRYLEGRTLAPNDVRDPATLRRIVELLRRCHREVGRNLVGSALMFWVFHAVRDYAATLKEAKSAHKERLPELLKSAELLEKNVGAIDIVFGHNDLLAANLIDDGHKLWLVDWEYAGYNSPLFDLSGLASNNQLGPNEENALLEAYFERAPNPEHLASYSAMKCASLLRETMWSMAAELSSSVAFDYAAYTKENLARFEQAYEEAQPRMRSRFGS